MIATHARARSAFECRGKVEDFEFGVQSCEWAARLGARRTQVFFQVSQGIQDDRRDTGFGDSAERSATAARQVGSRSLEGKLDKGAAGIGRQAVLSGGGGDLNGIGGVVVGHGDEPKGQVISGGEIAGFQELDASTITQLQGKGIAVEQCDVGFAKPERTDGVNGQAGEALL